MSQTAMARRRRGPDAAPPACALAPLLLALALAPGLVGCGAFRAEPPSPCPRAAILAGADTLTAYRPGAERARENARHYGALTDIAAACRYEDGGVAVDLRVALFAERGAAHEGGPVRLPYFVAVVGPDGAVIARETLTAEIDVPAGARRAGVAEELTQTIPGVGPEDAPAYRIFVGFQLDEDEARRRRGGR